MTDWRKTRAERAEARADELEDLIDLVRGESNELKDKLKRAEAALAWLQQHSMSDVTEKLNAVLAETDDLRAKLAAAEKACREVDLKTVLYAHMQNERDAALARVKELEAALAAAEASPVVENTIAQLYDERDDLRAKLAAAEATIVRINRIEEGRSASAIAQLDAALARVKEQAWRWEQHSARVAKLEAALQELLAETDDGADYAQSGPDSPGQAHARQVLEKKT